MVKFKKNMILKMLKVAKKLCGIVKVIETSEGRKNREVG
jgi:hypothetical protein